MKRQWYGPYNDQVFKSVVCKKGNEDLLKKIIEVAIKEEVEIISIRPPEKTKDNIRVKGKTLDVLVKTNKGIQNIELNTGDYASLHRRNAAYIFKQYSDSVTVGESYKTMPTVMQINLSCNLDKKYPVSEEYMLTGKKTKLKFIDNLKIFEFNIDKLKDNCYNENKEYKFLALIGARDKKELQKLCEGDRLMEKFEKEVNNLNNDDEFVDFLTAEQEERILMNTLRDEYREERDFEIAQNMLDLDIDIEKIIKATGLTKEEIEKLSKEK